MYIYMKISSLAQPKLAQLIYDRVRAQAKFKIGKGKSS